MTERDRLTLLVAALVPTRVFPNSAADFTQLVRTAQAIDKQIREATDDRHV